MLGQASNMVWKSNTDSSSNHGVSLWVRNGGILCLSTGENGPCLWTPIPTPVEQSTSTPKPKRRRIETTSITTTTTTETTTKIVPSKTSSGWPDYLQPGPSRTCEDTISVGGRQDCRTCTTSPENGGSYWKQQCRPRQQAVVPTGSCENLDNDNRLSCKRCYTSEQRTNWKDDCSPAARAGPSGDDGTNGKQCQDIAQFRQTCTRCTWLDNGRPQWHEDCRWQK
ncbi:hypothetical protein BV898_15022 [Hypsibius exemplaris]|uniref:Uncharacterized protein n=1 Tax=Hypsibius exemplaris TaxID=2072580 RepID=A0A9X6RK09_HYPEX|nr:hypothetical protein BV898_15022 [Hypsibius exemplaris]